MRIGSKRKVQGPDSGPAIVQQDNQIHSRMRDATDFDDIIDRGFPVQFPQDMGGRPQRQTGRP